MTRTGTTSSTCTVRACVASARSPARRREGARSPEPLVCAQQATQLRPTHLNPGHRGAASREGGPCRRSTRSPGLLGRAGVSGGLSSRAGVGGIVEDAFGRHPPGHLRPPGAGQDPGCKHSTPASRPLAGLAGGQQCGRQDGRSGRQGRLFPPSVSKARRLGPRPGPRSLRRGFTPPCVRRGSVRGEGPGERGQRRKRPPGPSASPEVHSLLMAGVCALLGYAARLGK